LLQLTFFVGYSTRLSAAGLCSIEWWDERCIGKDVEGSSHGIIKVLHGNLPGITEESHASAKTDDVLAEIPTKNPQNTSLEHYCYANTLSSHI
jgi:hypothetical protein